MLENMLYIVILLLFGYFLFDLGRYIWQLYERRQIAKVAAMLREACGEEKEKCVCMIKWGEESDE